MDDDVNTIVMQSSEKLKRICRASEQNEGKCLLFISLVQRRGLMELLPGQWTIGVKYFYFIPFIGLFNVSPYFIFCFHSSLVSAFSI